MTQWKLLVNLRIAQWRKIHWDKMNTKPELLHVIWARLAITTVTTWHNRASSFLTKLKDFGIWRVQQYQVHSWHRYDIACDRSSRSSWWWREGSWQPLKFIRSVLSLRFQPKASTKKEFGDKIKLSATPEKIFVANPLCYEGVWSLYQNRSTGCVHVVKIPERTRPAKLI